MITITKEQAKQIIEAADEVITALAGTNEDIHPDNSTKMVQLYDDLNDHYAPPEVVRELARIALASLEAKPLSQLSDGDYWQLTPLYTHPPAPVSVPDESAVESLATDLMKRIDKITGERHSVATLSSLRVSIVESCRSAMLQGAAGNSPDGWVACSERMPDIGTEIFYFCQDDGPRGCGIVSSSNFSDRGYAQLYVHAEGYDLRFGVDISHWMPLPAAPQQ